MPETKRTARGVAGGLAGLVGLSAVAGILVTAAVTPAIAVSGYAASSAISVFDNMPSYLEIDKLMLPTELLAKNSAGEYYTLAQFYDQNRIPVTSDQVAPVVYDALLSSEDKNFYSHGGIDLVGTIGAIASNLRGNNTRGGSSITQQYVKNVLQQSCEMQAKTQEEVDDCFERTTVATGAEGIERKLQEMRYAIQLEKQYSKNDILIGYLNIAHFGGTVYGIGAAAQYYFGVNASDLTIGQAAAIAGMVQEPNTYRIDRPEGTYVDGDGVAHNSAADGYAETKDRQLYVLARMYADGKITKAEYDEAAAAPIEPHITPRVSGCQQATGAEFFCDYVRTIITDDPAFGQTADDRAAALRRGGLKVYTTLDVDLQQAATAAMSIIPPTDPDLDLGTSGTQVEVGTGRVLSMVQNRLYSQDSDVLATDGNYTAVNYNVREANGGGIGHPAGSTYKVFSLVNWLEQGHSVNERLNGRIGTKRVDTCDGNIQTVRSANTSGAIGNFDNNPGYTGSVYQFTVDSLNSGFLAMAEEISVCSTNQVAMKLGVMRGDGEPLDNLNAPYDVLGSANVAPIDMAEAYAAIAAGGVLCEPKAIDRVTDADGVDLAIPQTTCTRVMSEAVAATAAYTLQGVMNGTGIDARTYDGIPIFGKTGIHEYEHTWMDGASTKVATVVWVGNVTGYALLNQNWVNGYQLSRVRTTIWPDMQRAANAKYGGDEFPSPDSELTKQVYVDLPNVIGMSVDQATQTLTDAGFEVSVGGAVDGVEDAGTVIAQEPGAGRVVPGTTVVIQPSNGVGIAVPSVSGTPSAAEAQLRAAGFGRVESQCTEDAGAGGPGTVTGTDPAAGTVANRNAMITVQYKRANCP
ncbi:transglycosylase domain-containing protein [Microbacterium sp.]|uniref:transglycosylase domain-containing protein n=1 Tax=Microbacterium sp. TaxID=51671 RepID=UPI0039E63B7E